MKTLILSILITLTALTANDLRNEQSPYLQQHADNPVAWMPWNKTTLEKAKREQKLIFLSIGYSTCHWCHVMEEESFEKQEVAEALSRNYIPIKVDREEMPQLDNYYQHLYQVMNGRGGGWPLTIVMTPDAQPFWSATYLPRKDLLSVLRQIETMYQNERAKITQAAKEIHDFMQRSEKEKGHNEDSDLKQVIATFHTSIKKGFDEMSGGFGVAPKFPRATLLEAMLDLYSLEHDKRLLAMVEETLQAMAEGGIYDQIEGGFYRYSVDGQWHIPHFEKMLYTQAELLRVYAKAYQLTQKPLYKKIVQELIAFIHKRFDKEGLLYSASDADSLTEKGKKEEGYYFVFDYAQTYAFLKTKGYSDQETQSILAHFHITRDGNFEHSRTNPHIQESKTVKNLEAVKQDMAELRAQKPYPFVDHKMLTSWNAMTISALTVASRVSPRYGQEAIRRVDTLLHSLFVDGRLYHQKLSGHPLKVPALFEDYAFLIDALVDVYAVEYDEKYLKLAQHFAKEAIEKFYDQGSWYLSDDAYKTKAGLYDSAYASAASVMTRALFKLSLQTDDPKLYTLAETSVKQNPALMRNYPDAVATAFDTFLGYKKEYTVLKSTKEALQKQRKNIAHLQNPYLLTRAIALDQPLWLACTMRLCFATDKALESVLKKIKER